MFWGTGTFVCLVKPDDALGRRFHHLGLATATALALGATAGMDVAWAKALDVTAFALLPALFLSFCLWFARETPPTERMALLVWALYGGGVAAGGLTLAMGLVGSEWYDSAHTLLLAVLTLGLLGGLGVLVHGYLQPRSLDARQRLGIVLLGTAAAILPLTALCLVPESLGGRPLARPQVAALSAVALPLAIHYAMLRRQLWEIAVGGRALVHAAMTVLLAACYLVFLSGFSLEARDNPLFFVAFFAAVAVTFIPVRDRVRQLIDRLMYGDRYDHARTLQLLGAQLASLCPLDEVLATVTESLAGALDLSGVVIFLRDPDGRLTVRATSGVYRDAGLAQPLCRQAERMQQEGVVQRDSAVIAGGGWWILLRAHGEESGLLYLGPRRTPGDLGSAELNMAATIANQVAVAVANTLLIERLRAKVDELELLRDRLLRVREEERKALARDLHHGAFHTVLDLVRQTQIIAQCAARADAATPHLSERLSTLVERGEDAAYELRAVCTTLYPSQLAHLGLVAAMEYLARTTSRDENVVVRLETPAFPTEQRLPTAVEDTLYRVAHQAIDNVLRHAAASTVTITLALEETHVVLAVRDDGRGCVPPASSARLLRHGHLGLVSMRESIEGLGGAFTFTSAPGAGTEVRVCVPLSTGVPSGMARAKEPAR